MPPLYYRGGRWLWTSFWTPFLFANFIFYLYKRVACCAGIACDTIKEHVWRPLKLKWCIFIHKICQLLQQNAKKSTCVSIGKQIAHHGWKIAHTCLRHLRVFPWKDFQNAVQKFFFQVVSALQSKVMAQTWLRQLYHMYSALKIMWFPQRKDGAIFDQTAFSDICLSIKM